MHRLLVRDVPKNLGDDKLSRLQRLAFAFESTRLVERWICNSKDRTTLPCKGFTVFVEHYITLYDDIATT